MPGPVPSPIAHRVGTARQYRAILQRWLWLLALCTLLGGVGAYVASNLRHPTYRATALMVVGQPTIGGDPYTALLASDQLVATYLGLISQPVVLQRAAAQVPGISARQLASQVSAKDQAGTQIIEVDVVDSGRVRAARLANAVAAAFIDVQHRTAAAALTRAQRQANQQLAQVSTLIYTLTTQLEALRAQDPTDPHLLVLQQQINAANTQRDTLQTASSQLAMQQVAGTDYIGIFQPATPPSAPDHPTPLQYAAIGGVLGLIIGAALVWVLEYFDERIRTPQQAEERLGLPVLATLGAYAGRALLLREASSRKLARDVRALVANLELAHLAAPPRTIAVTSAIGGEGKTTVAINLATALARSGKRILLVDADLHQWHGRTVPGRKRLALARAGSSHLDINELLESPADLPHPFGLSLALASQVHEAMPLSSVRGVPGLSVLPTGPGVPDPVELLRSSRMHDFLQWLADDPAAGRFDTIVLDTPPADVYADAALVARWADATVLVVDAAHPGEEAVARVKDTLQRAHASIIGVALNRASGQAHRDYVDDELQMPAVEPEAAQERGPEYTEEDGLVDTSSSPLAPYGQAGQ